MNADEARMNVPIDVMDRRDGHPWPRTSPIELYVHLRSPLSAFICVKAL
jgi:hypothetical protein